MDDETLKGLKDKVEQAEKLQTQLKTLDEVIASCNAEVGFMNIVLNYNNQNEIRLVTKFETRQVFDEFKGAIQQAAVDLRLKLEAQYNNLK